MEFVRNLLFLNRVYPPAEGATGELLKELAVALTNEGWQVTIVTSRPTAGGEPALGQGKGGKEVGKQSDQSGDEWGIRVERVRGLPFTRANHLKRAFSYFSLYPALVWRALRVPIAEHESAWCEQPRSSPLNSRPAIQLGTAGCNSAAHPNSSTTDSRRTIQPVIILLTDPPLLLVLGPILKWFKKCKLIHWAQDIYPEVAEELGVIDTGGWLARFLRRLSTWALLRHDLIIVVGRCMKQRLVQRGIDPERIVVIPNWAQRRNREANPTEFRSPSVAGALEGAEGNDTTRTLHGEMGPEPAVPAGEGFRRQHGLTGRFVVMYSGNFGLAHPFEAIIAAIDCLEKRAPQVLFLFIGSGPRLSWVTEHLKDRANVRFLPIQPKEKLGESLAAADLHLASMSENLCGLVVPSKVYGILAAERPCVFIGPKESEAAQILTEFDCGTVIACCDHAGLISAIWEYASDENRVRKARANTRYAMNTNNFANALAAFKKALDSPLSKK